MSKQLIPINQKIAALTDDRLLELALRDNPRLILAGTERPATTEFAYFMYDATRGSGLLSQFPPWLGAIRDRLIVSGGLNSDSVASIVRRFQPFGVDVSSGVESSPGVKDRNLMEKFITEVMHAGE